MASSRANDLDPRGDAAAAASNAAAIAIAPPDRALHLGSVEGGPGRPIVWIACSDDVGCARRRSLRKSVETRRVIRGTGVRLAKQLPGPRVSSLERLKCVEGTSWHFCRSCRC